MAYESLKEQIAAAVYANGRQEIDAPDVREILQLMVEGLAEGYRIEGVATPSTTPEPTDKRIAYFATTAGTYAGFGGIVLDAGHSALLVKTESGWQAVELGLMPGVSGAITTDLLANAAVTAEKVADNAIKTAKIEDGAITADKIASNAILTAKLANSAVTTDKIEDGAVEAAKIGSNAVTMPKIMDGSVTADKLGSGSVSTAKIANHAVTRNKIADAAISAVKIDVNAVTAEKIANGSVTTAKINDAAVESSKIAANAVTTEKIAAAAVSHIELANDAVESNNIKNEAVGTAKIVNSSVTAAKIANAAVTAEKVADNAIGTSNIVDGSITADKLAANSVTSEKIAAGAVIGTKLAANAVTASKIASGAVLLEKLGEDVAETFDDLYLTKVDKVEGKGLSTNDFTDAERTKLSEMPSTFEDFVSYGVEFDTTISSPNCTRIGNPMLHRSLPVQSGMRGCLLDDDGNVTQYLPANDWTSATRDGSLGQVMVEIPRHFIKFTQDGTKRQVRISELPLIGYREVPLRYVSAYQATVQRSVSKLASVVNMDADFRGCNNQSSWDGTYRTALGRPAASINLTSCRTYARNRKVGSTNWNCHTYGSQKAIYWLFVVEYANLNSQAAYKAELTTDGYRQGGLGAGVTNINGTAWGSFNSYNPFVPCGYTDEFGNGSGVKALEVRDGSDALFVNTSVNRYRGIEIPFGHIYLWTDGILVEAGAASDTNLHKVFVAKDRAKFSSSIGDGYAHVGNQARTNGYGKEHIFGEGGEIIAAAVGGSSTTYLCDQNYQSVPASGKATRGVRLGGSAFDGSYAGFVSVYSSDAPSDANARFGSRLCYLPTFD